MIATIITIDVQICLLQIDFEKSSSKKMEKDLRRTLAALEEERASAARHKQVALLLLKERKQILQRIASEYQQRGQVSAESRHLACLLL